MSGDRSIAVRGVQVHNLKGIDLDIPHRQWVVLCGLSGSGKSSLAFDTLYAEGQRRYIESFSAYTRQFLERLEKPAAERIDGIPPAIAVTHKNTSRSGRSTVGTATETSDYLRLLFAKIGQVVCRRCGQVVRRHSADSVAEELIKLEGGKKYLVTFATDTPHDTDWQSLSASLREEGFVRIILDGRTQNLSDQQVVTADAASGPGSRRLHAVVDRLAAGAAAERVRDSVETAFHKGDGRCYVFVEADAADDAEPGSGDQPGRTLIDGRPWRRLAWSNRFRCDNCDVEYPTPEPRLYSFNSPLGACPECEGFGSVIDVDMDLVVPDDRKSIREGAIAPWNTPAYAHELEELLALAGDYGLPVDVPYAELTADQRRLIYEGVPERSFGGLRGFFAWLERRKYKMHIRVFLSRWRSYRTCPACRGARLRPEALDTRIGGRNIAEVSALKIRDAAEFFQQVELDSWQRNVGRMMLEQVQHRLGYLVTVGLDYLSLDRPLRTLSGGETQRVSLTTALVSSLVNMLYVLDEP